MHIYAGLYRFLFSVNGKDRGPCNSLNILPVFDGSISILGKKPAGPRLAQCISLIKQCDVQSIITSNLEKKRIIRGYNMVSWGDT